MSKEYKIHNDGYGYLSAEFPEAYPITHIESDTTDTMLKQKIEAILTEAWGARRGSRQPRPRQSCGWTRRRPA